MASGFLKLSRVGEWVAGWAAWRVMSSNDQPIRQDSDSRHLYRYI